MSARVGPYGFSLLVLAVLGPSVATARTPAFVLSWGSQGIGSGQFQEPWGIATRFNRVYVTDWSHDRVQEFNTNGVFVRQWGGTGDGNGQLRNPRGVAVDHWGDVYVVEQGNNRVQVFWDDGVYQTKWGSFGSGDGQFNQPLAIAVDRDRNVYVADRNNRVQKFTRQGAFITKWGATGDGPGRFRNPTGLAVDGNGDVYVYDGNSQIQKFTNTGVFRYMWGGYGSGNGQFSGTVNLGIDPSDNVYATDIGPHRVQMFTTGGAFLAKWGSFGTGNGQFRSPVGVAADASGSVFVTDRDNYRVQVFAAPLVGAGPPVNQRFTVPKSPPPAPAAGCCPCWTLTPPPCPAGSRAVRTSARSAPAGAYDCNCWRWYDPEYVAGFDYRLDPETIAAGDRFTGILVPAGFGGIQVVTNTGSTYPNLPEGEVVEFGPDVTSFTVTHIPLLIDFSSFRGDEFPLGIRFTPEPAGPGVAGPGGAISFSVEARPGQLSADPPAGDPGGDGFWGPFPNPGSKRVEFAFAITGTGPRAVDIVDVSGRVVRRLSHGQVEARRQVFHWDLRRDDGRPVEPGVYYIAVRGSREFPGRKIVVR